MDSAESAEAHPTEEEPARGKGPARRSWVPSKLLLEAALIVLSVMLGFAVNAWQQERADRALADKVLANFREEMEQNLATLERIQPKHAAFVDRLTAASARPHPDSSAFDVVAAEMPADGLHVEPLRDAAWQTAVSTGALRLLDYETAATLTETYFVQRSGMVQTTQRLEDRIMTPESFDPARQRSTLLATRMLFNELSGQEEFLIGTYRKALRKLPRSGPDNAR
jgi:hypothetical protein